jgi:hypothetical protein
VVLNKNSQIYVWGHNDSKQLGLYDGSETPVLLDMPTQVEWEREGEGRGREKGEGGRR